MTTSEEVTVISCDDCVMQHTDACDECVVTFICGREPDEAVVFDVVEERAVRLLGDVGLVPRLLHARRHADDDQEGPLCRSSRVIPSRQQEARAAGPCSRERYCEGSTLSE